MGDSKRTKSFSLKNENADKVERISYEKKRKESQIVDEMIEGYENEKVEEHDDGC